MDVSSLTPSDLFSPSKARQHRAQAQDWAYVDSWLSAKYQNRSVPQFERNEDTLKVLLALAAANERADEHQEMLEKLEVQALDELTVAAQKKDAESVDSTILSSVIKNMSSEGQASLHTLADLADALDSYTPDPTVLAQSIVSRTSATATLSQHIANMKALRSALESTLASLDSSLTILNTLTPSQALAQQSATYTRQTKHLRTKLREYSDRLATFPDASLPLSNPSNIASSVNMERLVREENALKDLSGKINDLEQQVEQYRNLPPNKDAARKEIRNAEMELDKVKATREELFRGMVDD